MTTEHPITPPPELVTQWLVDAPPKTVDTYVTTQAARWGYQQGMDAELEECCEWLRNNDPYEHDYPRMLHAARRPKRLTLKEKALEALASLDKESKLPFFKKCETVHTIRKALEQLND